MRKRKRILSDGQVDTLPVARYRDTPERRDVRYAWGKRTGRAAYLRGVPRDGNPFTPCPSMPMAAAWLDGWNSEELLAALNGEFGGPVRAAAIGVAS